MTDLDLNAEPSSLPKMGQEFTPHVARATWAIDEAWTEAQLVSHDEPGAIRTASPAIHYAQSVFEGLKAYIQPDGSPSIFRVEDHYQRLLRSAKRMALPEVPRSLFFDAIGRILSADANLIPREHGTSLYLRPVLYSTAEALGPRPATKAEFAVIASPASTQFRPGHSGSRALINREMARCAPGGTGDVKTSANYGSGIIAQSDAAKKGFDQIIWLDPEGNETVEEMGAMNLFCVEKVNEYIVLKTPALSGNFLPGITRDSLITVARNLGFEVREQEIHLDDLLSGVRSGRISEVFGTGTAAFIAPLISIADRNEEFTVADGKSWPVTQQLWRHLASIHHGMIEAPEGWLRPSSSLARKANK